MSEMKGALIKTEIRLPEGESPAHGCHSVSDECFPRVKPIFRSCLCSWKLAGIPKHSSGLDVDVLQELVNILLQKLDLAAPFCKGRV